MLLLFYYLLLAIECLKSIFFCSNKSKTPVLFPQVLAVQVLMTILLIASTTRLAMVAVEWYKADKAHRDKYIVGKPYDENNVLLGFALVRYFTFSLNFLFLLPWWTEGTIRHSVLFSDEWRMDALANPRGGSREPPGGKGGRGEDFGSVTITFTWSTPKAQKYSNPPPSLLYSLGND